MSAHPIAHPATVTPENVTQATSPSVADIWAQDAQHYLQLLRELADTGAAIIRIGKQRIPMQADEPTVRSMMSDSYTFFNTPSLVDPHNKLMLEARESFDVVTRAIRRTIMLAQKIAQEPITAPPATSNNRAPHPITARDSIRRDIDEAINRDEANSDNERQDNQGCAADNGQAERPERLDSSDPEDDIAVRPIAHAIAEIYRELGFSALPQTNPQQGTTPQDCTARSKAAPCHA